MIAAASSEARNSTVRATSLGQSFSASGSARSVAARFVHLVLDRARADGVDGNVVDAELARQALREADQSELGGALGRHVGVATHPVHRGDVDDPAAAARDHPGQDRPAEVRRPGQIGREDEVPVLRA